MRQKRTYVMRKETMSALVDPDDDDEDELAGMPALYDSSEDTENEAIPALVESDGEDEDEIGPNISKATLLAALKATLGWSGVNKQGTWNLVVKYMSYTNKSKERMQLTRFNLFGKADLFRRFRMQRKFANFKSTLKRMIHTGK
ncbi:hypothetical protein CYMTET_48197 [Cymbomonas tetramitiformis]|uniref:Uncharacterized protein n=1 Tax=Cymbomonas tetramitiformis TaxID=36881 RepID=A0AAE0EVV6_9CHLO|nr:hypothetical protein CYMTET_48197 [Cymbomonas tetramitiformis]